MEPAGEGSLAFLFNCYGFCDDKGAVISWNELTGFVLLMTFTTNVDLNVRRNHDPEIPLIQIRELIDRHSNFFSFSSSKGDFVEKFADEFSIMLIAFAVLPDSEVGEASAAEQTKNRDDDHVSHNVNKFQKWVHP